MDPRYPCSQNSSFVGLIQNVHNNNVQEYFPYESFPSSVDIGASEIPPFSSQQSEAPPQSQETSNEKNVRRKWTPSDDEVLISAWLNTSKDPVVGNDQKFGTFWKRVDDFFAAIVKDNVGNVHCKQRWHRINDHTNKFCAAYAAAERQQSSGQSETDVLKVAHEIFYSDNGHKFTLEHCWCVLRYEQKWLSLNTQSTGSKRKAVEVEEAESPQPAVRPKGIKAAKANRNTSKEKAIEDFKSIYQLKLEDLAQKEKLSKLAILDTLLAKSGSLSESQEAVMNKLLAELF